MEMILPTLYQERERKAKRSYHCVECRSRIEKGESYTHVTGKWEGNFRTYRMCNPCYEAHGFAESLDGECAAFGHMHQKIEDFRLVSLPAHWHHNARIRERYAGEWLTLRTMDTTWFTRHVLGEIQARGEDPMDFPRPTQTPTRWDHINWESVKPAA